MPDHISACKTSVDIKHFMKMFDTSLTLSNLTYSNPIFTSRDTLSRSCQRFLQRLVLWSTLLIQAWGASHDPAMAEDARAPLLAQTPSMSAPKGDLPAEMRRIWAEIGNVPKDAAKAMIEQGVDASDRLIENALAGKLDPAANLLLGNLLFRRSPEKSFAAHERAARAAPRDPIVALEWAMQLHRAGRCRDALGPYELALATMAQGSQQFALQAHCLIVEGRFEEAVRTWSKVDHARNHVKVESLFADLFFPDPWRKRDELRRAARVGDRAAWVELINHDLHFSTDPWNKKIQADALAFDAAEAERALADDPQLWADLSTVIRWRKSEMSNYNLAAHVVERYPDTLPSNLTIASVFVEALCAGPSETPASVLARYRESLRRSAASGQKKAMEILAFLYARAKEPEALRAIDEAGCKMGMASFCGSLLISKRRTNNEAADLQAALARFPEEPWFAAFALQRVWARGDQDREALIRYLRLAPRRMSSSYGFKFAMLDLDASLAGKTSFSEERRLFATTLDAELGATGASVPR